MGRMAGRDRLQAFGDSAVLAPSADIEIRNRTGRIKKVVSASAYVGCTMPLCLTMGDSAARAASREPRVLGIKSFNFAERHRIRALHGQKPANQLRALATSI